MWCDLSWTVQHCWLPVQFIVKANAAPLTASKDKGGAKVPDKKGKNPPSPVEYSREKKTKLKRRNDVDPPNFKGKSLNLNQLW